MNTLIVEQTEHGEVATDVFQKLMENRILIISSIVDDKTACDINATLLFLDAVNDDKISLFINVENGDIRSVLSIIDCINLLSAPLETYICGSVQGPAVLLASAGTPGLRFISENSTVSLGQLEADHAKYGNLVSAKISLDQLIRDNNRMIKILSNHTGKSIKTITKDLEKRIFMEPKDVVKYGLADKVVKPKKVSK